MDEQRMKARQAKAGLNPGPGAYDVKRPGVTSADVSNWPLSPKLAPRLTADRARVATAFPPLDDY